MTYAPIAMEQVKAEPVEFTQAELDAADLYYLHNQQQREAARISFLHEQELNLLRANGGL